MRVAGDMSGSYKYSYLETKHIKMALFNVHWSKKKTRQII